MAAHAAGPGLARLEGHALRWRLRWLLPSAPWGVAQEDEWTWGELTPPEADALLARIAEAYDYRDRRRPDVPDRLVYLSVLDDHGIACPHPPARRTRLDHRVADGGYWCSMCERSLEGGAGDFGGPTEPARDG